MQGRLVQPITAFLVSLLLGGLGTTGWAQDMTDSDAKKDVVIPQALPTDTPPAAPAPEAPATSKKKKKEKPLPYPPPPPRTGAWSLGLDARQMAITPNDRRYKQRGVSPDINLGYVYVSQQWFSITSAHLVLGPTSQHFPDSPPIDYDGYGFSTIFGYSFSDLRRPSGDFGAELGLEAFGIVGRSFRKQTLANGSDTDGWVMRTNWTALTPALFATFLKPARPQGNRPEWLVTRIEGYHVSLGLVIPVQHSWDLRYERDGVSLGDRGSWKGIMGLFSVSAWLGI